MYGIALDLGTSGFRAQLIDLDTKKGIKSVMTMRHPLPGGNVADHLDFAIKVGEDVANKIIIDTVKKIIDTFNVDLSEIEKIVVCGNPIQLSLFQNTEIRDLAYAGENMQKKLGVENVKRDARIFPARELFGEDFKMQSCRIIVPPAIRHEIGADALAMMVETDFLNQNSVSIVTDYGTNAEMAIKVGDRIITGSAAAGPAIEGQGIRCGMLASPGAICDVNPEGDYWRVAILDDDMEAQAGYLIDPVRGEIKEESQISARGITGTGVIAAISLAIETGLMKNPPKLPNGKLFLGKGIELSEQDIKEAGKAIGAIRAAHLTLLIEGGVKYEDLENVYMSGASGAYVDYDKARKVGSCPNFSKKIVQFGNTSLTLAKDIVLDESKLDEVVRLAHTIKTDHLMMATSETFKNIYTCELAYWTEGMSMEMYDQFFEIYKIPKLPMMLKNPIVEKRVKRDIDEIGRESIEILMDPGIKIEEAAVGCIACHRCEQECPENAIMNVERDGNFLVIYSTQLCLGTSCTRCVKACPVKAINYKEIMMPVC